jgi:hypothetical protein
VLNYSVIDSVKHVHGSVKSSVSLSFYWLKIVFVHRHVGLVNAATVACPACTRVKQKLLILLIKMSVGRKI